jgi:hypothetical protein
VEYLTNSESPNPANYAQNSLQSLPLEAVWIFPEMGYAFDVSSSRKGEEVSNVGSF